MISQVVSNFWGSVQKIMHTMASEAHANRPKRRVYSTELKIQVAQECRQPGASIAGVALSHGINANIVHRWLREQTPSALSVPRRIAFGLTRCACQTAVYKKIQKVREKLLRKEVRTSQTKELII